MSICVVKGEARYMMDALFIVSDNKNRVFANFLENLIAKLRREIPDICLRTTLITGFPGETEKDHENLMEFINEKVR